MINRSVLGVISPKFSFDVASYSSPQIVLLLARNPL